MKLKQFITSLLLLLSVLTLSYSANAQTVVVNATTRSIGVKIGVTTYPIRSDNGTFNQPNITSGVFSGTATGSFFFNTTTLTVNTGSGNNTLTLADANLTKIRGGSWSMGGSFLISSTVSAPRYVGTGGTPTVAIGANAGTGATVSVIGNNVAGVVTITTGSNPTAGTLFTLTYPSSYTTTPVAMVSGSSGTSLPVFTNSESMTDFAVQTVAIPNASTTFRISYHILGR